MDFELTKEEIEELAAKGARSPIYFARVFFPEWFPQPMPWFHRGLLALLKGRANFLLDFGHEVWAEGEADWTPEELDKILRHFIDERTKKPIFELVDKGDHLEIEIHASRNTVVVLPRGFSKTTVINLNTCHEIAYRDTDFFLYVSETAPHAEEQLETVKAEFESNELLRLVFGDIQPARNDSKKWSANFIETTSGVMMGTVGTGGQIRGKNKHAKRPKCIVFDDLQNETSVESETERKKANRWFWRAAMKAGAKNSRKIICGTLLHKEAILNKAVQNRQFSCIRLGAIDPDGNALWPWHMDLEAIEEDRQSAIEAGELSGWYMEMMSQFHSEEGQMFPESKLIYIQKPLQMFRAISLALDPAISEDRKAALCAFAVTGIEHSGHKHVLDYYGEKGMDPADTMAKFFELHFKWMKHLPLECQQHGIEAIQYQTALIPLIRHQQVAYSRMFGQSAYFDITPITHGRKGKIPRIKGILKPLIWSNHLTFQEQFPSLNGSTPSLHSQFVDFPGDLLDGPDVVAMSIALLDPYVMLGIEDDEIAKLQESVANTNFGPTSVDIVVGGDWRTAP